MAQPGDGVYISQHGESDPIKLAREALPEDIASLVLRIGRAEWGATAEQTAQEHADDLLNTIRLTHKHFGTEDPQPLNGLYIEGTGVVICHTGMSPNSAGIARALTGAWNLLHSTALAALDAIPQPAPVPADAELDALQVALRSGRQADMEGVMVTVSRQACEYAADALSALRTRLAEMEGALKPFADAYFTALEALKDRPQSAGMYEAAAFYHLERGAFRADHRKMNEGK